MSIFTCLRLCVCQSDTNGSILYDHAKYVLSLVKVKIVLSSIVVRGGALEDVFDLEDTFSSPWPRSLKSSKIALSSARGQHYFLNA